MSSTPLFDPFYEFYHTPLSVEDWLAGGSLLIFCLIFIPLTVLVAVTMYRADKEIIGYRYLVSGAIADINTMLHYGFFNAVCILFKYPLTANKDVRSAMHFWIDWMWFAFCLHYPLVAWSRFAAIKFPIWFRYQKRWHSYMICLMAYGVALIMVLATHWSSWLTRFYYEPAAYGLLSEDFIKYLTAGHSAMFLYLHIFCVVVPFVLYLWTIALIVQTRAGIESRGQMSVEKRLMVPCILGNIIFVLGQVAITIGTGTGKWATWTVCALFVVNSAANSVLLLLLSSSLRQALEASLGLGGKSEKSARISKNIPSQTLSNVSTMRL